MSSLLKAGDKPRTFYEGEVGTFSCSALRLWEVILEGQAGFTSFILEKMGNHFGFLRKRDMEASCVGLLRLVSSSGEGVRRAVGWLVPQPRSERTRSPVAEVAVERSRNALQET